MLTTPSRQSLNPDRRPLRNFSKESWVDRHGRPLENGAGSWAGCSHERTPSIVTWFYGYPFLFFFFFFSPYFRRSRFSLRVITTSSSLVLSVSDTIIPRIFNPILLFPKLSLCLGCRRHCRRSVWNTAHLSATIRFVQRQNGRRSGLYRWQAFLRSICLSLPPNLGWRVFDNFFRCIYSLFMCFSVFWYVETDVWLAHSKFRFLGCDCEKNGCCSIGVGPVSIAKVDILQVVCQSIVWNFFMSCHSLPMIQRGLEI